MVGLPLWAYLNTSPPSRFLPCRVRLTLSFSSSSSYSLSTPSLRPHILYCLLLPSSSILILYSFPHPHIIFSSSSYLSPLFLAFSYHSSPNLSFLPPFSSSCSSLPLSINTFTFLPCREKTFGYVKKKVYIVFIYQTDIPSTLYFTTIYMINYHFENIVNWFSEFYVYKTDWHFLNEFILFLLSFFYYYFHYCIFSMDDLMFFYLFFSFLFVCFPGPSLSPLQLTVSTVILNSSPIRQVINTSLSLSLSLPVLSFRVSSMSQVTSHFYFNHFNLCQWFKSN